MYTEERLDDVTVLILCVIGMCTEGIGHNSKKREAVRVKRRAQGAGPGVYLRVARLFRFLLSLSPLLFLSPLPSLWWLLFLSSFLSLLSRFSLQNLLRRFVTFSEILSFFRLLKTFLSYQQVINTARFLTQLLGNFRRIGPFSALLLNFAKTA